MRRVAGLLRRTFGTLAQATALAREYTTERRYARRMDTSLTPEQGFHAMFLFLDQYDREMSGKANVRDVLSELHPAVGGKSSDPAAWTDWLRVVNQATSG